MTLPVDLSPVPQYEDARELARIHEHSPDITVLALVSWVRRLLHDIGGLRETIAEQEATLTEYRDQLHRARR